MSQRKLVLIADDHAYFRRLVCATLPADRYSVIEATDGREAWLLIRERRPNVAILDWTMPVFSGLELTAVIKGDPQLWHMTVILLTDRTTPADREAAAKARADLCLTKPVSPEGLLAAVDTALAGDPP